MATKKSTAKKQPVKKTKTPAKKKATPKEKAAPKAGGHNLKPAPPIDDTDPETAAEDIMEIIDQHELSQPRTPAAKSKEFWQLLIHSLRTRIDALTDGEEGSEDDDEEEDDEDDEDWSPIPRGGVVDDDDDDEDEDDEE